MENESAILDFEKLSVAEKILRLQDAWDRIAENPDQVEVTEAQKRELDSRIKEMAEDPGNETTWEAIKQDLQKNN